MWCEVMHFSILSEWYLKWFTTFEFEFEFECIQVLYFAWNELICRCRCYCLFRIQSVNFNCNQIKHKEISFPPFVQSFFLPLLFTLTGLSSVVIINIMICAIDFIFCIMCVYIASSICAWMDGLHAADRVLHTHSHICSHNLSFAGDWKRTHEQKTQIECTARRIFLKQLNSLRRLCVCIYSNLVAHTDIPDNNNKWSEKEIPRTDRHLKHLTCCFHYFAFWGPPTDCHWLWDQQINNGFDCFVNTSIQIRFYLGLGLLLASIYIFQALRMIVYFSCCCCCWRCVCALAIGYILSVSSVECKCKFKSILCNNFHMNFSPTRRQRKTKEM